MYIFSVFYHSLGIVYSLMKARENELYMISGLFLHSLGKCVYSSGLKGHVLTWEHYNSFGQWSEIIPFFLGSLGSNSSFKFWK